MKLNKRIVAAVFMAATVLAMGKPVDMNMMPPGAVGLPAPQPHVHFPPGAVGMPAPGGGVVTGVIVAPFTTIKVSDSKKAQKLWDAIESEVIPGSSSGWNGSFERFRVDRSENGLEQTVCTERGNYRTRMASTFSCVITKSRNGKPVPKFVPPPIRMG